MRENVCCEKLLFSFSQYGTKVAEARPRNPASEPLIQCAYFTGDLDNTVERLRQSKTGKTCFLSHESSLLRFRQRSSEGFTANKKYWGG